MNVEFKWTALAAGLVVVGLCLARGTSLFSAADKAQPNETAVKAFMHGKLTASQDVLEGLVTEKFDLIKNGADQMRLMSQKAEWNVIKDPVYSQYSEEFRSYCDKVAEAAKKKNIDAAALAYVQLTITCVGCHKFTRGVAVAETNPGSFRNQLAGLPAAQ